MHVSYGKYSPESKSRPVSARNPMISSVNKMASVYTCKYYKFPLNSENFQELVKYYISEKKLFLVLISLMYCSFPTYNLGKYFQSLASNNEIPKRKIWSAKKRFYAKIFRPFIFNRLIYEIIVWSAYHITDFKMVIYFVLLDSQKNMTLWP